MLPTFNNYIYMRYSQNLPLHPRIYPHFQQLYATLLESTPPSKNISPFSTTTCDPRESAPPSHNIPPPFSTTITLIGAPRISSSPRICPLFNKYVRYTQNPPIPPRIYPLFNNYIIPSKNLPLSHGIYSPFQQLYATLPVLI